MDSARPRDHRAAHRAGLGGDAAVVTGRTHARGTQSGAPFEVRLRFTAVFVRRGDQWQAVASHATMIAPSLSGPAEAGYYLFPLDGRVGALGSANATYSPE